MMIELNAVRQLECDGTSRHFPRSREHFIVDAKEAFKHVMP